MKKEKNVNADALAKIRREHLKEMSMKNAKEVSNESRKKMAERCAIALVKDIRNKT